MKQSTSIFIIIALFFTVTLHAVTAQIGGGPCDYDKFPGKIAITKILRTDASKQHGAPYEGFEVWFTFTPDKPVPGPWAERVGKPQLYQLGNSWYPGDRYLKKYAVKVGKKFLAMLSIIKHGTCSPVVFDLQGLNRGDYFESQAAK